MFESDFGRDDRSLVGISVSAVSLLLLTRLAGFCLVLFGMTYLAALLVGHRGSLGWVIGVGFITFGGCAHCIVTFWAWRALYQERVWALWIARTWAALLLLSGGFNLYHLYRPHTSTADDYFGIVYDPVLIIGGAVWLLYPASVGVAIALRPALALARRCPPCDSMMEQRLFLNLSRPLPHTSTQRFSPHIRHGVDRVGQHIIEDLADLIAISHGKGRARDRAIHRNTLRFRDSAVRLHPAKDRIQKEEALPCL